MAERADRSTSRHAAAEQLPPGRFYLGLLKTFSPKDGYGFILCRELRDAYGRDVYVHAAELPDGGVSCGTELRFSVRLNTRGQPQAREVSVVDTSPIDCRASEALLTGLCCFEDCVPQGVSTMPSVRVVSWNVLSPAYATCAAFPDADPAALRWTWRATQIRTILGKLQAHVICLQEAEVDAPPEELGLFPHVYSCLALRRPGPRSDGCIVAWRQDCFYLVRERLISFDDYLLPPHTADPAAQAEDARFRTGHCAVVAELCWRDSRIKPSNLVFATTHLAWGDLNEDVRLWQLSVLLGELQQFHGEWAVLCGDLNSVPGGQVYSLLSSYFRSAYEGVESFVATSSNANSEGGTGFAETIDYCWLLRENMVPCRRLRLPQKAALRVLLGGAPPPAPIPTLLANGAWPSDHLLLSVDVGCDMP